MSLDEIVGTYCSAWNEKDDERRQPHLLAQRFHPSHCRLHFYRGKAGIDRVSTIGRRNAGDRHISAAHGRRLGQTG